MTTIEQAKRQYPNKYRLTPKNIKKITVLDWDRLMTKTWHNNAKKGNWWCHLEGCQNEHAPYCDEDEFWIGFDMDTKRTDCDWSSYGGMCTYDFETFYDPREIRTAFDLRVQANTIRWLNQMIDAGILAPPTIA